MYDPSKPVRILIIDDDEDDFILTSGFLKGIEDRSLDIQWCYNYKAALQQIASKAFLTSSSSDLRKSHEPSGRHR